MINAGSRYTTGVLYPLDSAVLVFRSFGPRQPATRTHTWKQSDRLDRIADRYLGNPALWWKIMDVNPLVQSPSDIRPGQEIRIPNRV